MRITKNEAVPFGAFFQELRPDTSLESYKTVAGALADLVASMGVIEFRRQVLTYRRGLDDPLCRRKPTHDKTRLASERPLGQPGWVLHLHDYKIHGEGGTMQARAGLGSVVLPPGVSAEYTEQSHNHQQSRISVITKGGLTFEERQAPTFEPAYAGTSRAAWMAQAATLEPPRERRYGPGDIMCIWSDEIHRLTGVVEGTETFAFEFPQARGFSVVWQVGADGLLAPDRLLGRHDSVVELTP